MLLEIAFSAGFFDEGSKSESRSPKRQGGDSGSTDF